MSRARVHEVSSPISLFPFIGILLCTMGALLVILVRSAEGGHRVAMFAAVGLATVWSLVAGLSGLALVFAWFFTKHHFMGRNENLMHFDHAFTESG